MGFGLESVFGLARAFVMSMATGSIVITFLVEQLMDLMLGLLSGLAFILLLSAAKISCHRTSGPPSKLGWQTPVAATFHARRDQTLRNVNSSASAHASRKGNPTAGTNSGLDKIWEATSALAALGEGQGLIHAIHPELEHETKSASGVQI